MVRSIEPEHNRPTRATTLQLPRHLARIARLSFFAVWFSRAVLKNVGFLSKTLALLGVRR